MEISKRKIYLVTTIIAGLMIIIATWSGLGYGNDSANYYSAAQNLISGKGLTISWLPGENRPLTQFPPGYPLLLALLGANLFLARILHVFLYVVNTLLIVWVIDRATHGSIHSMLMGAFLTVTTSTLLDLHAVLLTEAIFLFCTQLFLIALYRNRIVSAAVLGVLAFSFRYAGVALLMHGFIYLSLFERDKPLITRIKQIIIFSVVGSSILLIWFVQTTLLADAPARPFAIHIVSANHIAQGIMTVARWFLPPGVLIVFLALWLKLHRAAVPRFQSNMILPLYLLFIGVYLLFLLISISFFDFLTPLDHRILSPVLVCSIITFSIAVEPWLYPGKHWKGIGKIAIRVVAALMLLYGALNLFQLVYLKPGVANLEANSVARINLLSDVVLYSNAPAVIFLSSEQRAYDLPIKVARSNQVENPNYSVEVEQLTEALLSGDAAVVYFTHVHWDESYLFNLEDLQSLCSSPQVIKEGYIFTRESCQ